MGRMQTVPPWGMNQWTLEQSSRLVVRVLGYFTTRRRTSLSLAVYYVLRTHFIRFPRLEAMLAVVDRVAAYPPAAPAAIRERVQEEEEEII